MEAQVTTFIPTYRRPALLRRALASVLRQSYPHFEVHVIDNASGDETPEVVREVAQGDPRVKFHIHEKNIGAWANIQYGMKGVATRYFSMLGDDDVMLPEFYATAMAGFAAHPDAAFSGGRCLLMDESGEPIAVMPNARAKMGYQAPPEGALPMLAGRLINHLSIGGLVFRTDVVRSMGEWKAVEDYPFDIDFMLRTAARHPYVLSEKVVSIGLMHSGNRKKPRLPLYRGWIQIYRDFIRNPDLSPELRAKAQSKFLSQLRRSFTKIWFRCVAQGDWVEAYLLVDLVAEELGQSRWGATMLRGTQFFRKNPNSERGKALARRLQRIDEKYILPLREEYRPYTDFLTSNEFGK